MRIVQSAKCKKAWGMRHEVRMRFAHIHVVIGASRLAAEGDTFKALSPQLIAFLKMSHYTYL